MKSVTILTLFPSGLTTKNPGEHHSEGSGHGVMTPLLSSSLTHASAGSLKHSEICLAAETRYGVAFSLRWRCTFSECIGLTPSLSLNTLGKAAKISRLIEVSTVAAVGHGNEAGMLASLIMSCQDISSVCLMPVATRAAERTVPFFVVSSRSPERGFSPHLHRVGVWPHLRLI